MRSGSRARWQLPTTASSEAHRGAVVGVGVVLLACAAQKQHRPPALHRLTCKRPLLTCVPHAASRARSQAAGGAAPPHHPSTAARRSTPQRPLGCPPAGGFGSESPAPAVPQQAPRPGDPSPSSPACHFPQWYRPKPWAHLVVPFRAVQPRAVAGACLVLLGLLRHHL